jgi:hypothetical protein
MARVPVPMVIFQSCTNVFIHVLVRKIHALFLFGEKCIDVVHSEFRRGWYGGWLMRSHEIHSETVWTGVDVDTRLL